MYTHWIVTLFILLCTACTKRGDYKPASRGLAYELLIVVEKNLWNSELGDSIRAVVEASIPSLPQPEPHFRVMQIGKQNFRRSFISMATILKITIDPTVAQSSIGVAYDPYASPQIMVNLTAATPHEAAHFVMQQREQVLELLVGAELKRESMRLIKRNNAVLSRQMHEQFGYYIDLPAELKIMKIENGFLGASEFQFDKSVNFYAYTLPYLVPTSLTFDEFAVLRDSVTSLHLRGATDSSYVETRREFGEIKPYRINNLSFIEVRGLWQMRHEAMGGPFVAHLHHDLETETTLVIEGSVYAPGYDKRQMIRRIEAALYTLRSEKEPRQKKE